MSVQEQKLKTLISSGVKAKDFKKMTMTWGELKNKFLSEFIKSVDRDSTRDGLLIPWDMIDPEGLDGEYKTQKDGETYSRCADNLFGTQLLVLDVDNKATDSNALTYDQAVEFFTEQGWTFVIYTSYNHLWNKKEQTSSSEHRYRIIMPMLEYCSKSDYFQIQQKLKNEFFFADPTGFGLTHSFYLPMTHPDRVALARIDSNEGDWFDWRSLTSEVESNDKAIVLPKSTINENQYDLDTVITFYDGSTTTIRGLYWGKYERGKWHNIIYAPRLGNGKKNRDASFLISHGRVTIHDFARDQSSVVYVQPKKVDYEFDYDRFDEGIESFSIKNIVLSKVKTDRSQLETQYVPYFKPDKGGYFQHNLEEEFLPDSAPDLIDKGLVFIKSPKGTGKTEMLKSVIAQCRRDYQPNDGALVIGHRVNLLANISERIGVTNYKDVSGATNYFATSVDSLATKMNGNNYNYKTIIIDEVEQVLNHLSSSTLRRERKQVFSAFVNLIKKADRVIVLDADLSAELTVDLIRKFRGDAFFNDDVQAIVNTFPIGQGRTIRMFSRKLELLDDLINTIAMVERPRKYIYDSDGSVNPYSVIQCVNNVFIATNTIKWSKQIEQILLDKIAENELIGLTQDEILVVNSSTIQNVKQQAFIRNPGVEGKKYKIVISSPSMNTGVSIDGNHFTHNYGFFFQHPFNAFDRDQAMARNRNKEAVNKVWMEQSSYNKYVSMIEDLVKTDCNERNVSNLNGRELIDGIKAFDEAINEDSEFANNLDRLFDMFKNCYRDIEMKTRVRINCHVELNKDDEFWIDTFSRLRAVDVMRMKDVPIKYLELCVSNGYKIDNVVSCEDSYLVGKMLVEKSKFDRYREEASKICQVDSITAEMAAYLEKKESTNRWRKVSVK